MAESPVSQYNLAEIKRLAREQLGEDGKVEGTHRDRFLWPRSHAPAPEGHNTDAEGRKKLIEDEMRRRRGDFA